MLETCSCKHNMISLTAGASPAVQFSKKNMISLMAEYLVEILILECFLFLGPQIFN